MRPHSSLWPLSLFVPLCLLVTLLCLLYPPALYHQDAVHYLSIAEHLARGEGYRSAIHLFPDLMQPPLFPLLIAGFMKVLGSSLLAARVVVVLSELGTLLLLYRIHTQVFGARGRVFTALCAAVY